MNLIEIRELFRNTSGRYDLVNDDFSDNGADLFINDAIKWLDSKIDKSDLHRETDLWSSPALVNDTDTNFWSENYPLILVQATIFKTSTGNRPLMKSYIDALTESVKSVDMDLVERQVARSDQMEG